MRSSASSKSASRLGPEAERRVRRHYRVRGFRILAANAWVGGYELDLVVRRGSRLVFCEVKAKSGEGFGNPWEMITPEKARRVRRAAETWLAAHPDLAHLDVMLEAVAVRGRRVSRVILD